MARRAAQLTDQVIPRDPPCEIPGEGRSYGPGWGPVEFEVAPQLEEFVGLGIDVIHDRRYRCQRGGGAFLPLVCGGSAAQRPAALLGFRRSLQRRWCVDVGPGGPGVRSGLPARMDAAHRFDGWIGSGRRPHGVIGGNNGTANVSPLAGAGWRLKVTTGAFLNRPIIQAALIVPTSMSRALRRRMSTQDCRRTGSVSASITRVPPQELMTRTTPSMIFVALHVRDATLRPAGGLLCLSDALLQHRPGGPVRGAGVAGRGGSYDLPTVSTDP